MRMFAREDDTQAFKVRTRRSRWSDYDLYLESKRNIERRAGNRGRNWGFEMNDGGSTAGVRFIANTSR